MLWYQKIDVSEGIEIEISEVHQKNVSFVTIGFLFKQWI